MNPAVQSAPGAAPADALHGAGAGTLFIAAVQARDRETMKAIPSLVFHGDELRDFSDTAALCELMDLVISVDTSVAHLAGALGKPVWIMLPRAAEWRWMVGRDDSPWYAGARLFRQRRQGEWRPVVDEVLQALGERFGAARMHDASPS